MRAGKQAKKPGKLWTAVLNINNLPPILDDSMRLRLYQNEEEMSQKSSYSVGEWNLCSQLETPSRIDIDLTFKKARLETILPFFRHQSNLIDRSY